MTAMSTEDACLLLSRLRVDGPGRTLQPHEALFLSQLLAPLLATGRIPALDGTLVAESLRRLTLSGRDEERILRLLVGVCREMSPADWLAVVERAASAAVAPGAAQKRRLLSTFSGFAPPGLRCARLRPPR